MSFHLHYLLNHLLYFSSLNLFVSLLSNCWMLQVKVQRFPVLYSSSPNKQNLGGETRRKKKPNDSRDTCPHFNRICAGGSVTCQESCSTNQIPARPFFSLLLFHCTNSRRNSLWSVVYNADVTSGVSQRRRLEERHEGDPRGLRRDRVQPTRSSILKKCRCAAVPARAPDASPVCVKRSPEPLIYWLHEVFHCDPN